MGAGSEVAPGFVARRAGLPQEASGVGAQPLGDRTGLGGWYYVIVPTFRVTAIKLSNFLE